MMKPLLPLLALACGLALGQSACLASDIGGGLEVIATTRVQVAAGNLADLRNVIADFTARNGFGHRQESTMPPNRKIFLMAGAFSTTFPSKQGYYLLVHNVVGKQCVAIDLYANRSRPSFKGLMASLQETIESALPKKAKIVTGNVCK